MNKRQIIQIISNLLKDTEFSLGNNAINIKYVMPDELLINDSIHSKADEMIGFFNITKTRKILSALYAGEVLRLKHQALGDYIVRLNPQRNVIGVNGASDKINENNIMSFIVGYAGNWYIVKDEDVKKEIDL